MGDKKKKILLLSDDIRTNTGVATQSKELIWGTKEDAYMQVAMVGSAYDASVKFVDTQLSNDDYFAATDWKENQGSPHHFGFAE